MNPFRGDVLGVTFVLALPLLLLWYRGDFTVDDVTSRLPWCFLAGWGAVALLRFATASHRAKAHGPAHEEHPHEDPEFTIDGEHAPAS
jgi:hypothetical protein